MKQCNKCNVNLIVGENWSASRASKNQKSCKSCEVEKTRLWKKNNPEKLKSQRKRHRQTNNYKKAKKLDILKNPEKYKEQRKRYKQKNPGIINALKAKRRAIKLNATPSWFEKDKIAILYEKAKWLESITGLKYHVDHIIPLQGDNVCGLHVWANLQILEASINIAKSNNVNLEAAQD